MADPAHNSEILLKTKERAERVPDHAVPQEIQRTVNALARQPRNTALHLSVGLLQSRTGNFEASTLALKRALKLSKDNPIILGILALVYQNKIGDHENAIKYLRRKLKTEKRDVASYMLIANSYMQLGQPLKAIEFLNKAESYADSQLLLRLIAIRSQCYQRIGDFDSAKSDLMRLAKTDPTGIISVADVLSRMPNIDDKLAEKLESATRNALEKSPEKFRDDTHKAMTAVAVGEISEGKGKYEEAFEYFQQGRQFFPFDSNAWSFKESKEFELYKGVYDKTLFTKLPAGHPSNQQIFIVGMPRSGTTLLESILGASDAVMDHGELMYFIGQQHLLGLTSEKNPDVKKRTPLLKKLLTSAPEHGFRDIGEAYIKRYGFDRTQGKFHVDKMPHNFRALGLIAATFPNARIIHAARHPMDICLSIFKNLMPGYNTTFSGTLELLGEFYLEYAKLMKHWQDALPVEIHTVRYETLVADTGGQSEAMFQYIGLDWNPALLETRQTKGDVATASMWQVRQDIYSSSVQKWRNYETQLKPLYEVIKDEVEAYERRE